MLGLINGEIDNTLRRKRNHINRVESQSRVYCCLDDVWISAYALMLSFEIVSLAELRFLVYLPSDRLRRPCTTRDRFVSLKLRIFLDP